MGAAASMPPTTRIAGAVAAVRCSRCAPRNLRYVQAAASASMRSSRSAAPAARSLASLRAPLRCASCAHPWLASLSVSSVVARGWAPQLRPRHVPRARFLGVLDSGLLAARSTGTSTPTPFFRPHFSGQSKPSNRRIAIALKVLVFNSNKIRNGFKFAFHKNPAIALQTNFKGFLAVVFCYFSMPSFRQFKVD